MVWCEIYKIWYELDYSPNKTKIGNTFIFLSQLRIVYASLFYYLFFVNLILIKL